MFQQFQEPPYAGFWLRFGAYIVDSLIISIVSIPLIVVLVLIVLSGNVDPDSPEVTALQLAFNGISALIGWLHHALMESSSWQATVGKKVVGIRVTDLDGNRISFGRATGRYFGKIVSGLICSVGFIMAAFTEKKQALHDMIASTLVLHGSGPQAYPVPPPPPDFVYPGGSPGIG